MSYLEGGDQEPNPPLDASDQVPGPPISPGSPPTTTTPATTVKLEPPFHSSPYFPMYVVTGVSGLFFLFAPVFVRRGPYQGLVRWCLMLTIFCLWMFWIIIYIAQLNPLVGPRLSNTSLAWVGYYWGNDAKTIKSYK